MITRSSDEFAKTPFRKMCRLCCEHKIRNNSHAPDRAVNRSFLVVLIYAYVQLYLAMISRALLRSYVLLCVLLVVGSYPLDIIVYPASLSTLGHLFTIVIVIQ